MTTFDTDTEAADETAPAHPPATPRRRRRRPGPPAHPLFQYVFALLVVAAGLIVFLLYREGARAVLDSTEGRDIETVTDPAAPGYLALVTPTPTMLVAHVDDAGVLVGVTVLVETALDEGGNIVVLSGAMLIDGGDIDPVLVGERYDAEGTDGLEQLIGGMFGFGFTDDAATISTSQLAGWFSLVEPIPFVLNDDLVEVGSDGTTRTVIEAGGRGFDGATLAEVFSWRNAGQPDATRFTRQAAIWEAWLDAVGEAEDLIAATTAFDGFPSYLRSLGTGPSDVSLAPISPLAFNPENPVYVLAEDDLAWPVEKAAEMVPFPIGSVAGDRPTLQVLDGTGDPDERDRMLPLLVDAGAEIWVIGNAPAFDVTATTVAYHDEENQAVAESFAGALDLPVVFVEDPNQPAQLTVTIGTDVSE